MTKGSYTKAALKGYGSSYTKAALKGYGSSYTKAALKGYGKSYTKAALKGFGSKKPSLTGKVRKGSLEAKARMAYLRSLRGKGSIRSKNSKLRGGEFDIGKIIKTLQSDEVKQLAQGPIGDLAKSGLDFWKNWYGENVSHNKSIDAQIAEYEKMIREFKKLPPDEQDALRLQYRKKAEKLKTKIKDHSALKDLISRFGSVSKKIKTKKEEEEDIPPPPPPPLAEDEEEMEDDDEIPPPPPTEPPPEIPDLTGNGRGRGKTSKMKGGRIEKKDVRDGFLGPAGWIAMGVRKSKERKLEKLQKEWRKLIFG